MTCVGCKHHIGAGCCRINLEDECAAGGGYEAWEPREEKRYTSKEFIEAAAGGWGGARDAQAYVKAAKRKTFTTADLFELRRRQEERRRSQKRAQSKRDAE